MCHICKGSKKIVFGGLAKECACLKYEQFEKVNEIDAGYIKIDEINEPKIEQVLIKKPGRPKSK